MDEIDLKICGALQENARFTYAQIGARVGLAASSVHDRVRKLEKNRVIRAYSADIDFDRAGLPITAFVSLALRPESPSNIPKLIAEFPIVESCYSVAGDNSYALIVRAPDTAALEELLDALRAKLAVTTRSTIVLSTPFEHRPILAVPTPENRSSYGKNGATR